MQRRTVRRRIFAGILAGALGLFLPPDAQAQTIPAPPSNLTGTVVASNQVNLSWTDNSNNETGFVINRAPDAPIELFFVQIGSVLSNVTSFVDLGVVTNHAYWYGIQAYNSAGTSAYSGTIRIYIPALPAAPSALTATAVATNQINLVWSDNSTNETGFKVERALDNAGAPGTWSQITMVLSNLTAYSDTTVLGNTRYWYRVRATNTSGDSPYSNQANASTASAPNVWINPASDKWEIATNWSQGVPSVAQSGLLINNPNTKTVTIDATTVASNSVNQCMTVAALTISSPAGTTNLLNVANSGTLTPLRVVNSVTVTNGGVMNVTNAALRVDGTLGVDGAMTLQSDGRLAVSNSSMYVGVVSTGQVTMTGGSAVLRTLMVASNEYSAGTFTMTGGNMTYSNAWFGVGSNSTASVWLTGGSFTTTNKVFSLIVGRYGNAQMTVSNGATLTSWITWLGYGNSAVGTLTVAGGNAALGAMNVANYSNSTAAAWVSGGQLSTTNQGLYVGDAAYSVGQMTISNGTVLTGNSFGGTALTVGGNQYSTGTLTLSGGTLTSMGPTDNVIVAFSSGSTGSVWISSSTITATNGPANLYLALSGSGQMTLSNGAVTVGSFYDGVIGGSGTLTMVNGTFSILSNSIVSYGGTGSVWVAGGQLLAPNGLFVLGNGNPGQMTASGGVVVARNMMISSNNAANTSTLSISGGQVTVYDSLVVGDCLSNAIGQITISGGILYVTNAAHTGYIDVRGGTLSLSGGSIVADVLVMTNTCGVFVNNGGTFTFGRGVFPPNQSWIGDGIPDGWKQQYGLSPFDFNLVNEDLDGSGFTVLQDYLAGIDPTNPAAAFRIISLVQTGEDVLVTWNTAGGQVDVVQAAPAVGGSYSNISSVIAVAGSGVVITNYLDIGGATNGSSRFYRVALVQPSLDHFGIFVANGPVGSGVPFPVTITAYDSTNGLLAGFNGTVTLSVTSSIGSALVWPITSPSFTGGEWKGDVTVTALNGASVTITATDSSGHGGQSSPLFIAGSLANVLIPASSTPADVVEDSVRGLLYMTVSNQVLRYDLINGVFLTPFTLGGNLRGLDISPDNNTLVVADTTFSGSSNWVYVVDLPSGLSRQEMFSLASGEAGTWAVAFGFDGAAIITSGYQGSGWSPMRRYDPVSGTVNVVGGPRQDSMVSSSGDGRIIAIAEANATGGPFDLYYVAAQQQSNSVGVSYYFLSDGAANRDGTQFAALSQYGVFVFNSNLTAQVSQISTSAGCAYNPQADEMFVAVSGAPYVQAFETHSFREIGSYNCGYTFPTPGYYGFQPGRTRVSRNGNGLFVTVGGGVRWISFGTPQSADLSLSLAGSSNLVHAGGSLTYMITITNNGPSAVSDAKMLDSLPSTAIFLSANASQGTCTFSNGVAIAALGAVASGGVATVSLAVTAPAPIILTNTAVVTSSMADPDLANNAATLVTSVIPGLVALNTLSPLDYSYTTNSTVTVTGTSSSPYGVATVSVNAFSASTSNGYTNWTATVSGLSVGTNTLVVTAADNYNPPDSATNLTHVIYAAGSYDGNGDGLPDAWQLRYFGCVPCPAAAPGNDPDGTGFTTLQDYLAGTDPTNPAAAFRITSIVPTGNNLLVTWIMGPNRTNALQASAGNGSGEYNTNGFVDIFAVTNTIGTVTNYLDAGAATNLPSRYYRVRIVP